jgi:hypothetical protein
MRRALMLLCAVLVAQYGYRFFEDPVAHRWAFYVARGLQSSVACALLIRPRAWVNPAAVFVGCFASVLGMLEEAQTSVCGIAEWRASTSSDLCIAWMGGDVYAAGAALAVAALVVFFRRERNPP